MSRQQSRRDRAGKAKLLLDDDVFRQALRQVELTAYETLLRTPDDATRRMMIDRINVIRDVEAQLRAWIVDGHQAENPIDVP